MLKSVGSRNSRRKLIGKLNSLRNANPLPDNMRNRRANEIMQGVGGGQDLVVTVNSAEFDKSAEEFTIKMSIAFNRASQSRI